MVTMRRRTVLAVAIVAALGVALSACEERPLLRDNYVGKALLQPRHVPRSTERDGWGNPVLEDSQKKDEGKPKTPG